MATCTCKCKHYIDFAITSLWIVVVFVFCIYFIDDLHHRLKKVEVKLEVAK
jgi:hypothetical protein